MKKLYFECASGISGDMTVAALLDLGADEDVLKKALASLPLHGYAIEISRVKKSGLDCCDFDVILDAEHENHDHDMEYLHGHSHDHPHDHEEEPHNHTHNHEEQKDHPHSHIHAHEHRGMYEAMDILKQAELSDGARKLAVKIFTILGEAEAKAHGTTLEQVHFHEVGAVDSIVDIVGAAVCLDNLEIQDVVIQRLAEGQGMIRCQHGLLPIPVPAVANIAAAHSLKLEITETQGELVTPTGAAIAAAIRTEEKLPKQFQIVKIGIGAGKRTYDRPSILRVMILETEKEELEKA